MVYFILRFPGQYRDVETGLNYNMARDYDPAVGRYIQSDPLGPDGGSNSAYAYAGGNPVANMDATGLIHWSGEMYSALLTYGWAYVQLGDAFSIPNLKPDPSIGVDASVAAGIGRSNVYHVEIKKCACKKW